MATHLKCICKAGIIALLLCSVYYRHISSVPLISLLVHFKATMWGLDLLQARRFEFQHSLWEESLPLRLQIWITELSANKNRNPTERFPRSTKNPTRQLRLGWFLYFFFFFSHGRKGNNFSTECRGFVAAAGRTAFPDLEGKFERRCKKQMCRITE